MEAYKRLSIIYLHPQNIRIHLLIWYPMLSFKKIAKIIIYMFLSI